MRVMFLLMGEQPAANLLPVRHDQPELVVIVHTTRAVRQAARLAKLLDAQVLMMPPVDPYRITAIVKSLRAFIGDNGWENESIVFNLTGGTKPMSFASYEVARELGASVQYFQTEGNVSRIYHYAFTPAGSPFLTAIDDLPEAITLDDYLGLYLDDFVPKRRGEPDPFEAAVAHALRAAGLEVMTNICPIREGSVEIDLVVRDGNQFGIMQLKRGKGEVSGLNQVAAVAGQRHLGTYIKRFLISREPLGVNGVKMAKALSVILISLPHYDGVATVLDEQDRRVLVEAVHRELRPAQT